MLEFNSCVGVDCRLDHFMTKRLKVGIAGASGFLGKRICERILSETPHTITALSRSANKKSDGRITPIKTDFFSLKDAEQGLAGCDIGIYLIHSMSPSNRLSQGNFTDFDFILADNFARAAAKNKLKQIIYVGGIVPVDNYEGSRHLRSRLEVEKTLASYQTPLTTLRCSLVIGPAGSSFVILKKLVYRLRAMVLPAWMKTKCQPIYIEDLVSVILQSLNKESCFSKTFDVGQPEVVTYRQLILYTAKCAGLRRLLIDVPAVPLWLSKFWIRLITGASKSLVYPLVDSLRTPMAVSKSRQLDESIQVNYTPIEKAIEASIFAKPVTRAKMSAKPSESVIARAEVKSVQRLPLPEGMNAYRVARLYFRWLPKVFSSVIRVKICDNSAFFYFGPLTRPILVLSLSDDRSTEDRQLFYITEGLLVSPNKKGRFEFRVGLQKKFIFAAIHDFQPALPWFIYRGLQAPFHALVMWGFGRFLSRIHTKRQFRQLTRQSEP